jgi:uncharacterized lipoprotein YddW (UPF0748 family)
MAAMAALAGVLTACLPGTGGGDGAAGAEAPRATATCPAGSAPDAAEGRALRGMWIATVRGTDWPGRAGHAAERQRAEYRRLMDAAKALHFNAVFVHVRPTADAFYASPHEPWSQWITGRQGRDPGYDVLGFMLREAHARGLEFHAWFNPYRVSPQKDLNKLAPNNPARRHPGWVRRYGDGLWYDPGLPQVRDLVSTVILDVVREYDIDGVHFDDYFYPYPAGGDYPDRATFKAHGKGFDSTAAWRRHNVNTLVERVSGEIHRAKPWVRFGISPFGVWRNRSSDPDGSATRALQSYDDIYADSRLWVKKGWVDYIAPQLYWPIGDPLADYRTLTAWWARQVRDTGVQLMIGHGAYRVGAAGPWRNAGELSRQLTVNGKFPEVRGAVFFSARDLVSDRRGFATKLRKDHYRRPALVPVAARRAKAAGSAKVTPPATVATGLRDEAVTVRWRGAGADAARYAVYRVEGRRAAACAEARPGSLIAVVGGGVTTVSDAGVKPGATYTYYVAALDRLHRASAPAHGSTITVPRG